MLDTLRLARCLQVWVLLLLAGSIGAAAAAPWVGAAGHASVVCSEHGGTRLTWHDAGTDAPAPTYELQCPLCLPLGTAVAATHHAAAGLDPMPDAPCIGRFELRRSPISALRPPARAPPPSVCPSTR